MLHLHIPPDGPPDNPAADRYAVTVFRYSDAGRVTYETGGHATLRAALEEVMDRAVTWGWLEP